MRALTLWQPWASLIAWGLKQYETRSWRTDYRGPLAIHAGMTTAGFKAVGYMPQIRRVLAERSTEPHDLPRGAVLCIVQLEGCYPITPEVAGEVEQMRGQDEIAFGDWSDGRYAWRLRVLEQFDRPVRAKGNQGFWEWERPANVSN